MTEKPDWLPELVRLEDFGGDWERFIEAVYAHFKKDFVESQPSFKGQPVRLKRHPMEAGKEATFWHIISEGKDEANRLPDLRRCERIRWPRAIIEHFTDYRIKCWVNRRRNEKRIVLWLGALDYVVILADRGRYVLLWTAYCTNYRHTRKKLQAEYESSLKG
jgi:hypothetical protein